MYYSKGHLQLPIQNAQPIFEEPTSPSFNSGVFNRSGPPARCGVDDKADKEEVSIEEFSRDAQMNPPQGQSSPIIQFVKEKPDQASSLVSNQKVGLGSHLCLCHDYMHNFKTIERVDWQKSTTNVNAEQRIKSRSSSQSRHFNSDTGQQRKTDNRASDSIDDVRLYWWWHWAWSS